MVKKYKIILFSLLFLLIAGYFYIIFPVWGMPFNNQRHGQLPLTPSWALETWLWEDDTNTAAYVDELLEGYKEHDIPVRTIILDSPWSLRYNDFEVDTIRYPEPEKWFKKIQDNGYRVVLWMTPSVNSYSKDTRIKYSKKWYTQAKKKGFLLGGDTLSWWKGQGGFVDYTNTDALKWWQGMQQKVFDYGIDGWKLDGAATLAWTDVFGIPFFYKNSSKGLITTRSYMDMYYRMEYKHGLSQNPEFITLSRSIDRKKLHPEGFAPFDAAPVNWVGDQKHTWEVAETSNSKEAGSDDLVIQGERGIGMALTHIMQSAKLGYNIIGSDVAGFSGNIIPPRLYIRWAQFSTFCGLFMNGGHSERRLWKRTKQELEIIRKFSWLHDELIPYMYHYVVTAHNGGQLLQTPLDKGKYQFMFGDDLLVAPIYADSQNKDVYLPKGKWRYFFKDKETFDGNQKINKDFPLEEFPVFVKDGAIIPLNIERSYSGFGTEKDKGYISFFIYPAKENSFIFYHLDKPDIRTTISYSLDKDKLEIKLKGAPLAHILNIHLNKSPENVFKNNKELQKDIDWFYNPVKEKLIIKFNSLDIGRYEIIL